MSEKLKEIDDRKYKFKELNIYSSTEWLANNSKRYRQVFHASEISYIDAELSFYNKMFDEENWTVNVKLNCYEAGRKKKMCSLEFNKKVSKQDSISHVREGWGNKKEGSLTIVF